MLLSLAMMLPQITDGCPFRSWCIIGTISMIPDELGDHQKYAPIHSQPQWTQDGGVTLVRAVYWPWGSGAVAWFGVAAIALIVESCELELLVGV